MTLWRAPWRLQLRSSIVIAGLCVICLRRAASGGTISDNSTLYRPGDHAGGGGRLLGLCHAGRSPDCASCKTISSTATARIRCSSLRIQNELNSVGISMRDMLDTGTLDPSQRHPLTAWQPQFERMRVDLEDAFRREQQVSPEGRTEGQQRYLLTSLEQFWNGVEETFDLARQRPGKAGAGANPAWGCRRNWLR